MPTVMRTSEAQRNRIKEQEGLRLNAYKCTAGKWTVGWGHAETNPRLVRGMLDGKYYEGKPKLGVSINLEEARRLFDADIDEVEHQVSELITVDLAQCQYDSLIDFVFQFGIGNLTGSTLVKKINFNPNNLGEEGKPGILDEFPRWNRENGERVEHVWRRSCRRACIYNNSPIPQALWRKNGFPFALTIDDQIDYSITPSVHKIIAHGIKAAEKPVFDPSKPLPEPTITIITDKPPEFAEPAKDELILAEKLPPSPELATSEVAVRETMETSAPSSSPPASHVNETPISQHEEVVVSKNPSSVDGSGSSVAITLEPASAREEVGGPLPPVAPKEQAEASVVVSAPTGEVEVEAKSSGSASVTVETPEAKHPVNSWSIWGGMILYFLPDLGPFAEKILTVEIAGPIGHALRGLALAVLIFGRMAASMPISIKANAKMPTLRKNP